MGRDHLQLSVFDRHYETEAHLVLIGRRLHCPVCGFVDVGRARIEPGQHSPDRGADQFSFANRFDGILADAVIGFTEQVQLFVAAAPLAAFRLRQNRAYRKQCAQDERRHHLRHSPRSPRERRHISPGAGGCNPLTDRRR